MGRLGEKVFMKTGAEGVYCGGLPALGLGFALKIDDGSKRAAEALVEAMLTRLYQEARGLGALGPIKNWRGIEVGETRIAATASRAFDGLR